jgi:DNA ligase-associated metallophosphoesterase
MRVVVADEDLELLPERAVYWAARKTLFVADTHWGKAAAFRAHSIPVPHGTTGDDLARLEAAIAKTGAERLVLLGDAIHAREGRSAKTMGEIARWREAHRGLDILLVRGNHDKRAGDPPEELRIRCEDAPVTAGPFVYQHHPAAARRGYALAGHVHPGIRLHGKGRQRERLACFYFGPQYGILPAFGSFTGSAIVTPGEGDRVFAIAGDDVIPVTGL